MLATARRLPAESSAIRVVEDLADVEAIFDGGTSAVIWRRPFPDLRFERAADLAPGARIARSLRAERVSPGAIARSLSVPGDSRFAADVAGLAELFATLTGAEELGLRVEVTDRRTCPKFHTDQVVLRLITAYEGQGTEFLDGERIVGAGTGDVCLCKGELWPGTRYGAGVHRSPDVPPGQRRVLLTIDAL